MTAPIREERILAAQAEDINQTKPRALIRQEQEAFRGASQQRYGGLVAELERTDHSITDWRTQLERALANHSARSLKEKSLFQAHVEASCPANFIRGLIAQRTPELDRLWTEREALRQQFEPIYRQVAQLDLERQKLVAESIRVEEELAPRVGFENQTKRDLDIYVRAQAKDTESIARCEYNLKGLSETREKLLTEVPLELYNPHYGEFHFAVESVVRYSNREVFTNRQDLIDLQRICDKHTPAQTRKLLLDKPAARRHIAIALKQSWFEKSKQAIRRFREGAVAASFRPEEGKRVLQSLKALDPVLPEDHPTFSKAVKERESNRVTSILGRTCDDPLAGQVPECHCGLKIRSEC